MRQWIKAIIILSVLIDLPSFASLLIGYFARKGGMGLARFGYQSAISPI